MDQIIISHTQTNTIVAKSRRLTLPRNSEMLARSTCSSTLLSRLSRQYSRQSRRSWSAKLTPLPPQLCRSIGEEATPMFYQHNHFATIARPATMTVEKKMSHAPIKQFSRNVSASYFHEESSWMMIGSGSCSTILYNPFKHPKKRITLLTASFSAPSPDYQIRKSRLVTE